MHTRMTSNYVTTVREAVGRVVCPAARDVLVERSVHSKTKTKRAPIKLETYSKRKENDHNKISSRAGNWQQLFLLCSITRAYNRITTERYNNDAIVHVKYASLMTTPEPISG